VDQSALNVLDLTNPELAAKYGYSGGPISSATQAIGNQASASGYNAIRYFSERVSGGTNLAILDNYNDILHPIMVTPTAP
jgi:filamentous hemagglutinin